MRRNSSLVTTTHRGDPWPGPGGPQVVGPLPRTAVMVGAGSTPPGVDLDRVAASISSGSLASLAAPGSSSGATPTSGTSSGPPPPPSSRQFGGRIAVAISGAAQNLKSRISNIGATPAPRGESSPPDNRTRGQVREVPIRMEGGDQSSTVNRDSSGGGGVNRTTTEERIIPTNAPHAEHFGFPIRLDKRPLGPRDTPQFAKKQEYL